jgi:PRTRC genetic system protein E
MFKPLYELARTTALVMTITADEKEGTLTLTVNPKPVAKDAPAALSQPLTLKATPEELDTGFVEALTRFGDSYASLKETVDSAVAVMEAAKKETAAKATSKSAAKVTAPAKQAPQAAVPARGSTVQAAPAGDEDADDEVSDAAPAAPAAPDTQTINLFA